MEINHHEKVWNMKVEWLEFTGPCGNHFIKNLHQGTLYRTNQNGGPDQLVVLQRLKQQILKQVHNHRLGGHFGVKKTIYNLRARFWWPGSPWGRESLVSDLQRLPASESWDWLQDDTSPGSRRFGYGKDGNGYLVIQGTNNKWKHLHPSGNRLL